MDQVAKIIEALQKKEAYPHTVKEIKVIITAVSVILLTGEYVYKFNKPLNLGFLDFSTLNKRKEQCEKEVKYNSLISPKLYLGVSCINQDQKGIITIDGSGETIEYAIKMKQMNPDAVMSSILKEDKIGPEQVRKLAEKIHAFHQIAPTDEHISSYGKLKSIKYNWDENFVQTQKYKDLLIPSLHFDLIQNKVNTFLEDNSALIESRVVKNKIKHCHGDFHSGNVFVTKEDLHIFDGIVFNERFPCSDVIAEVAFMAMDLEYHERTDLSNVFIAEYQKLSGDEDISKLLNFYKCYRAYIRAKINCFTWEDPNLTPEKKLFHAEEAKKYFELSNNYALALK